MTALLLLGACVTTVSSVEALCAIPYPTFTEQELLSLSDTTLMGVDLYFEQNTAGCKPYL